jgi:hypothetical protein
MQEQGIQVRLDFPEELRVATYANYVVVSATPHEFAIAFAQLPPVRDEPGKQEVVQAGSVRANVVASIVVSHQLLPDLITVLQKNYASYQALREEEQQ